MKAKPASALCIALALAGCAGSEDDDEAGRVIDDPPTDAGDGADDDGEAEVIDVDSYELILREIVAFTRARGFDAVTKIGEPAEAVRDSIVEDGTTSYEGLSFVSFELGEDEDERIALYACEVGGGSLRTPFPVLGGLDEIVVEDCRLDETVYDGGYSESAFTTDSISRRYESLSATGDGGAVAELDGRYAITTGRGTFRQGSSWTDTSFSRRDEAGRLAVDDLETDLLAFGREVVGDDEPGGFVRLPDGTIASVTVFANGASRRESFAITAPWSEGRTLAVSVDFDYRRSFFDWGSLNVPGYPLEELGSPLTLSASPDYDPGPFRTVELVPPEPAEAASWDEGTLVVTADDGSTLTMRQSAEAPSEVEIRLNGAEEPIVRERTDGFAVSCPGPYDGEGCR